MQVGDPSGAARSEARCGDCVGAGAEWESIHEIPSWNAGWSEAVNNSGLCLLERVCRVKDRGRAVMSRIDGIGRERCRVASKSRRRR